MNFYSPTADRDPASRVPRLSKTQLAGIVSIATDAIISIDSMERITFFNEGAERLFGWGADEVRDQPLTVLFPACAGSGTWQKLQSFARKGGTERRLGERLELVGYRKGAGDGFPVEASLSRIEFEGERIVTLVLWNLTEFREAEQREQQLLLERTARAAAEEEAMRMRALTDAGRLLLSSLDYEAVLGELPLVVVPTLADHCIIRLVDDGGWGRIAVRYSAPGGEEFARQLQERYPLRPEAQGGIHHVLRTGEPILYVRISEETIAAAREDREYLQVLQGLGVGSFILAPLVARGQLRGSLGFFMAESGRRYGAADLAFVQDLAMRIALAIDNARLYREAEIELAERRRAEDALRESEARFRVMADMAPVLIWMSNLDGLCHFFNKPWLEFTGRTSEEESGEGWLAGVHRDDQERYLGAYLSAFEARQPITMEYRLRHRDGEYRWILDHGVPRFTAEGEFAGYIGSCIDVTEQIEQRQALADNAAHLEELTAELEQTVEELELRREEADAARAAADDASRAKSRFLAVMSHELRTPLNAILGYGDLLDAEVAGPINTGQRQHLHRIQQSALHLLDLINKLLSFSRIEAGKEEVSLESVDLAELARDAVALVEPQAARQGLELRIMIPDIAIEVETDPGKVRQILLNLLSNAVKFTEAGEVEFRMLVEAEAVSFLVRDTGPGIPAEEQQRIFEAFTQGDGTRTRKKGGTGLGLSVSRELARLLGGEIGLESEPSAGSSFTVRLPLRPRVGSISSGH
jgi:PAS domain S-box-containing protein